MQIPSHAKRVFKGILFDTYQWQQKLYDGTFTTYEKIKRKGSAMMLPVTSDNKILVSKESQAGIGSFIGLFGGKVEEGEDHEIAAKRELLEEAGFIAGKVELLWDHTIPTSKLVWDIRTYIARDLTRTETNNLESGERIELLKLTFDEFVNLAITDKTFREYEVKSIIMEMKLKGQLGKLEDKLFRKDN